MKQRIITFLQTLQLICRYDRSAVIAGLISILTLLAARFGLRLNASDTAYLASALTAAVVAFTHVKFALASRAPAAPVVFELRHGEHEKS